MISAGLRKEREVIPSQREGFQPTHPLLLVDLSGLCILSAPSSRLRRRRQISLPLLHLRSTAPGVRSGQDGGGCLRPRLAQRQPSSSPLCALPTRTAVGPPGRAQQQDGGGSTIVSFMPWSLSEIPTRALTRMPIYYAAWIL